MAGPLSVAAGEYVSVSSQAHTEQADLKREKQELATEPQAEEEELTSIYVRRGLVPELSRTVAQQLTAKGALAVHACDELGLTEELAAQPMQAAFASAAPFAVGARVPIATILVAPTTALVLSVFVVSLLCLVALGAAAARIGGAPWLVGATRVHGLGRIGDGCNGCSRKALWHDRRIVGSRPMGQRIVRLPHFAHASLTDVRQDLKGTEFVSYGNMHPENRAEFSRSESSKDTNKRATRKSR